MDAPEGAHSYEMKFFPKGMKTGIGLSAAALLTTLMFIPADARARKKTLEHSVREDYNKPVEKFCSWKEGDAP